jgi:hypothetical protein
LRQSREAAVAGCYFQYEEVALMTLAFHLFSFKNIPHIFENQGRRHPQTSVGGGSIIEYTDQLGCPGHGSPENVSIFSVCETLFHAF